MIRAVVGAGGKTGLIKSLARQYRQSGKKVFVTTSTHMFAEKDTLLTDDADLIIRQLEENGYAMAGVCVGEKIGTLSEKTYLEVCAHADEVLIEADGSKHMAVKFPAAHEPVIYDNVEEICVVCGLHALHKTVSEAAHRPELVKQCLGIDDDMPLLAEQIQKLVRKGYVEPLKEKYPEKEIKIHAAHNGSLYQRALAGLLAADMDVSVLREEWFAQRPKLVICGGGHVSAEVAKIAACLDFSIKIIDDRPEFASKERFPMADEVICDSFDKLDRHVVPGAYYIVVTRGHKADHECVRTILSSSYQYLGMIGSKLKVAKTFENLRLEGISEEQIGTIHAPIGLKIKAVTPAEIAVSILAEIILEKNSRFTASASWELLESKESGVLCIITGKTGSSPRGVGSMMFVGNDKVIDSIGGGVIELAVLEDAKSIDRAVSKTYRLDNETSEKLGMICGGTNTVLFIPV